MSDLKKIESIQSIQQVINQLQPSFTKLAVIHNAVTFEREASFALQILQGNDYLARVAMGNMDSLKKAVLQVAAIGLSLNPVFKLAYLVPRKNAVCLDVSYRGFVQLATDAGAIKWAKAEIVRKLDRFKLSEYGRPPEHVFSPFEERGEIVGAYCVAKTHDGEFLITTMSIKEIFDSRNRSDAWKAYERDRTKTNPWVTDEAEMIKKTVIRRAYKTWPTTDTRRLEDAALVSAEVDVEAADPALPSAPSEQDMKVSQIKEMLAVVGRTEDRFISHCARTFNRKLASLNELTDLELTRSITFLNQMVDERIQNENAK